MRFFSDLGWPEELTLGFKGVSVLGEVAMISRSDRVTGV